MVSLAGFEMAEMAKNCNEHVNDNYAHILCMKFSNYVRFDVNVHNGYVCGGAFDQVIL